MKYKSILSLLLAFVCTLSSAFAAIQAGQVVEIKIMGVPAEEKVKIDENYPISEKGMINLPFIGEMNAAGLEAGELAKRIQEGYKVGRIFNNAVIQVIANAGGKDLAEEMVHLGGQVRAPGPRPFRKGLTVFQAVQAGGGATEFGALNRVVVYREGKQLVVNFEKPEGKAVVAEVDDTIEVPQKNWRGR